MSSLKRLSTLFLTLLLTMALCIPAMANDTLIVNDRSYQSPGPTYVSQCTTMMPLEAIPSILGASVSVEHEFVVINKNGHTLTMQLGSPTASLDGQYFSIPQPPVLQQDQVYIPLRSTLEALGAEVLWSPNAPLLIRYEEQRAGKSADEIMTDSSLKMMEVNTYRMVGTMLMDMNVSVRSAEADPVDQSMRAGIDMVGYYSTHPLQVYTIQNMRIKVSDEDIPPLPAISSEYFIDKNGVYVKLPDQEWALIPSEGLDWEDLIEQSMNQDPVQLMKQMQDMNILNVFANDQERDGQKYWVINSSASDAIFQSETFKEMMKMPGMEEADLDQLFDENMQMNMTYSSWINQETLYTDYMEMEGSFSFQMKVPEENTDLDMDCTIKASYQMSDYGEPIPVPDVSNAQELDLEAPMDNPALEL